MRHRNKEHDHRVNKQNGDIKMKTDKKQNERIQINRIKCWKWQETASNEHEKPQIKQKVHKR